MPFAGKFRSRIINASAAFVSWIFSWESYGVCTYTDEKCSVQGQVAYASM